MKVRFAVAVTAVIALALPTVSSAAKPSLASLQRQVNTLTKQVKALQKRVADLDGQIGVNWEGDTCLAAQTADLLQGTWSVIDQVAGKTIFGPQTQVPDYNNCADLSSPEVPRPGIKAPPTISPFLPLLQWLHEDVG